MSEPITLGFIFETIAVVLSLTAIGIFLVKRKKV
jgi:hypothetical protein